MKKTVLLLALVLTIGFGITHYLEKNEAQSPPSPSPSIDWPLVAKHLQERPVSSAPLINQIQSLPADELTQSLAEISESHLAPKSQRLLTTHLTRLLLKASPSHLLTHPASTPITNNIWEVEQGKAMFAWVGESPKAAISWFDPLASVSFTGPPRTRLNFEIINALTLRASVPDSDRLRFADRDRFGEGWFKNYSELAITEPVEKYAILVRLLPPRKPGTHRSPAHRAWRSRMSIGVPPTQQS